MKSVLTLLLLMLFCFQVPGNTEDYKLSEEPVELSIHFHIWNRIAFDNDWEIYKRAAELSNVKLKGTASKSATDSEQVFNLMLVSGEIPDIVVFENAYSAKFIQYAQEGAFLPLNDLINNYAPNIKGFLDSHPEIRRNIIAPDGNLYYIPYVPDGEVAMGWFIRKDWLDKLDLEIPETIDEYYQVLKAFKEQDPNGNGKQDEIPYFSRFKNVNDLLIFWNARSSYYIENSKVHYGPYEDQYQVGVKNIVKWYKEGLIDPEIFTRGDSSREVLFRDNLGGSLHDWFVSTARYNSNLEGVIENFNIVPMAPPKAIDNVAREETKRSLLKSYGWGMSYSNKNPEITMKYFDFWWTERGRRLFNYGIEGDTYEMVDGKPVFKDWILNSDRNTVDILYDYGAQLEVGAHQDFEYEKQLMNPTALKGVKMYIKNGYPIEQFPNLKFTTEERDILDNLQADISTFVEENFQKWVLGAESVEENFEKYQDNMKEMGIEKILNIYQAAYDRYINNL